MRSSPFKVQQPAGPCVISAGGWTRVNHHFCSRSFGVKIIMQKGAPFYHHPKKSGRNSPHQFYSSMVIPVPWRRQNTKRKTKKNIQNPSQQPEKNTMVFGGVFFFVRSNPFLTSNALVKHGIFSNFRN